MENFDINRFFKIFGNNKLYIAFILLLCLAIGYFYSFYYITPMYKSSATAVLIQNESLEQEIAEDSSITQTDITLNKNLLSTYTKIAKSDTVIQKVIEDLNLNMTTDELKSLVNVQSVNNTQVFKISVSNKNKELSPVITNHLLEVFSEEVNSLYHMNNIYTMDKAEVVNEPYNINHIKDLSISFVIGLVLSFGLVVLFYLFDNTIKSEKDIEEYANLSVLSTIPMYTNKLGKKNSELIVNEQPKSPIAECFKTFRTNVMFSIQNKKLNTILVTSGSMGEGKSFVSSNLAVAFANSGKKVILVDTDMRKGRVHKIFDLSNEQGLSTCLSRISEKGTSVNINDFIKESCISNLHVMTSGIVPPNPSELLSSSNMIRLLEALNRQYDVVICDGTPCTLVSDSIILSKIVDTTIIVTANKSTRLDSLLKIKKAIEMVGGNISGAVLNKTEVNAKSYQNNYYYGNHNNSTTQALLSDTTFVHDVALDKALNVKDLENINTETPEEVTVSNTLENIINHEEKELTNITNNINENKKQIEELKNVYKTLMQDILVSSTKSNDSDLILKELQSLKQNYMDNLSIQNEEIKDITKKYEEQINSIHDKIDNLVLPDNSSLVINEEIENITKKYEEQINSIHDKIDNLVLPDNSSLVLEELQDLKQDYKDSSMKQNEEIENLYREYESQINSIYDKIDSLELTDNSELVLDELQYLKQDFKDNYIKQNEEIKNISKKYEEQINSIYDRISTLELSDNSIEIFEQLDSLKESYNDKLTMHMDLITQNYEKLLEQQNQKFDELYKQINAPKTDNQDNELLSQVVKIYNQLENMSIRFESLEQRATNNEILIKNLSNVVKDSFYQPSHSLDLDKLNSKVIQIQDYLEKTVETVEDLPIEKSSKKNKSVLDGQLNILDSLINKANEPDKAIENIVEEPVEITTSINEIEEKLEVEVQEPEELVENVVEDIVAETVTETMETKETVETIEKSENIPVSTPKPTAEIVDYETVKKKQSKKGFSLFRSRSYEVEEEEPIEIVSQILSNRSESVS